jgi:hypothetical protein
VKSASATLEAPPTMVTSCSWLIAIGVAKLGSAWAVTTQV